MALPDPADIDAVIFDAGGVLLLPDAAAGRALLRELGYEPRDEDWERAHYLTTRIFDAMAVPDWPEVRRAFARALGVADADVDAAAPLIERLVASTPWTSIPGVSTALHDLGAAGFKLGVVSNSMGTIREQLESGGVCTVDDGSPLPRVAVIVDSHHVGVEKPDPRIFHLALRAMEVEAARSVYIGDTVSADMVGAAGAGLHGLHLDPYGLCTGEHPHLGGLRDLLDWLVPNRG